MMLDFIKFLVTNLLGPGGFVLAMITLFRKSDPLPREVVEDAKTSNVIEATGVADRWKEYADDISERLSKRIAEMEERRREDHQRIEALEENRRKDHERIEGLERREKVHYAYEIILRDRIEAAGHSVPGWPFDIDPSNYTYMREPAKRSGGN